MTLNGYHSIEELPIKAGDRVRIKKGTPILNCFYKGRPREYEAGKTYVITVDHVMTGHDGWTTYRDAPVPPRNPSVRWPGPGGYWLEADINDVEKVS